MISFYTTCKGRLSHLEQTLPHNIKSILDSGIKVEIVLLDYASPDGLSGWVKDTQMGWIENGLLNYYSYNLPEYYHSAHAKNVAASLCSNGIICNVDADNLVSKEFITYVLGMRDDEFISVCEDENTPYSLWGSITCWKTDFLALNGYNEDLVDYGFDDREFARRLRKSRKQRLWKKLIDYLPHTCAERVKYFNNKDVVDSAKRNEKIAMNSPDVANLDKNWGKAVVVKNFKTKLFCSRGSSNFVLI